MGDGGGGGGGPGAGGDPPPPHAVSMADEDSIAIVLRRETRVGGAGGLPRRLIAASIPFARSIAPRRWRRSDVTRNGAGSQPDRSIASGRKRVNMLQPLLRRCVM